MIFRELEKSVENMGPESDYHGWKIGRSVTNQWWFYAAWLSTLFVLDFGVQFLLVFGVMVLENIS